MVPHPALYFLKAARSGIYAQNAHEQDNSLHGNNKDQVHAGFGGMAVTQPYNGSCTAEY